MLWLPGIVFLAVCLWVVRKLFIAARNEDVLDQQRFEAALGQPLPQRPQLVVPPPAKPLDGADVSLADPAHLPLVEQMAGEREAQIKAQHPSASGRRVEVLWVRSNATHAVWCERRHPASTKASGLARDVICVAQIKDGAVGERWFFG